jgi:hypothetical protein
MCDEKSVDLSVRSVETFQGMVLIVLRQSCR